MIYLLHWVPKLLRHIFNPFLKSIRSLVYDELVVKNYTERMNEIFLESILDRTTILDIGIGTGTSMTRNATLIVKKQVQIDGIDIDEDYIARCEHNIYQVGLQNFMTVKNINIYDYETDKKYDYVLFSDSYAVIPDVHEMIEHSKRYLKPTGQIIILTTLDDEATFFKALLKPRLVYITLAEFGKVTTKDEFIDLIQNHNRLTIDELKVIVHRKFPFLWGDVKSYLAKLSLSPVV